MKSLLTRLLPPILSIRGLGACASIATILLFTPALTVSAAQPTPAKAAKTKVVAVSGVAITTLTSLVFNDDGTIAIEAVQVGHLSYFGEFTGQFTYVAIPSATSILIRGTAILTNEDGDHLYLTALILEQGADYPYAVSGALTVTGGTGRFASATGLIAVTGNDTVSPTDTLNLDGTLVLIK
jgi:hypothetical protein